jgi:hypothetical protein
MLSAVSGERTPIDKPMSNNRYINNQSRASKEVLDNQSKEDDSYSQAEFESEEKEKSVEKQKSLA